MSRAVTSVEKMRAYACISPDKDHCPSKTLQLLASMPLYLLAIPWLPLSTFPIAVFRQPLVEALFVEAPTKRTIDG